MEDEASSGWKLSDEDRGVIALLAEKVADLRSMAQTGWDLAAVGEAWSALERLPEGGEIDISVGLEVGYRRGTRDFSEGRFACLYIGDEGIRLDVLNTTYSSDVGSDHFTEDYGMLTREGGFGSGVIDWLGELGRIAKEDDAELSCARDHL